MLYIHATAKLAKAIRTKLEPCPVDDTPWIEHWYANTIALTETDSAILMTNAVTLYSFVIPFPHDGVPFFAIVEQFRKKLRHAIADQGASSKKTNAIIPDLDQYVICKTASRSVLGSMNDFAFAMRFYADRTLDDGNPFVLEELEASLNGTPMKPLGYHFPVERFREQLRILR